MITKNEYFKAINELVMYGLSNKYGLNYFENKNDLIRVTNLRKIMYEYENQTKEKKLIKKKLLKK